MHSLDDIFDSLDRFDTLDAPGIAPARTVKTPPANYIPPAAYFGRCGKCNGTGQTRWGACFRCKGNGAKTFKTSPAEHANNRQANEQSKVRNEADKVAAFAAAHPEIAAWIEASADFEFAVNMRRAVAQWGSLTEKQIAACERCIARNKTRAAEKQERDATAPTIDISKIETAFAKAIENGIKKPLLRLDAFKFSRAGAESKNPGALYVKEGDTYLGKIQDGKFFCTRECDEDRKGRIIAAAADPAVAAKTFGQRTGTCSCCGRELTNSESIDLGIGPICASKYGW